jgi:SAM-dependent methyltransferase
MSERAVSKSGSGSLPFNTAGAPDDFADPALQGVAREVFPSLAGDGGREHWRGAMAVRALRELGALGPAAEVLCVRAGAEMPIFHLTGLARRVTAVDRYLDPVDPVGERHPGALMLTAPDRVCPLPFVREKLTVLAMDGRILWLPDGAFAALYAPEVERFGSREEIAAALFEMGRVLAPGGVLALSAALRIAGEGTALSPDELRRWVIAASGLEPVDEPALDVPETTLTAPRRPGGLVAVEEGSVSVPVALALRKTERYPVSDNDWARPSDELRARVRAAEAESAARFSSGTGRGEPSQETPVPAADLSNPSDRSAPSAPPAAAPLSAEDIFRRWDAVRARTGLDAPSSGGRVARSLGFLRRTAGRVRDLGTAADLQRDLFRALLDRQTGLDQRLSALGGLGGRIAALESELAGLHRAAAEIQRALDELRTGGSSGLANLRDRQETLRARQARLEGALADLREELSALSDPSAGSSAARIPLSAADVAALLAVLDDGSAGAVEVSFQDSRAETLLLAARRHFGGRLSSTGPSYRSPNDLWLHLDFTTAWSRPILLDNAAARLAPGGRFLLITAVAAGEPPRHPKLELEEDRVVTVVPGAAVRVLGWRR